MDDAASLALARQLQEQFDREDAEARRVQEEKDAALALSLADPPPSAAQEDDDVVVVGSSPSAPRRDGAAEGRRTIGAFSSSPLGRTSFGDASDVVTPAKKQRVAHSSPARDWRPSPSHVSPAASALSAGGPSSGGKHRTLPGSISGGAPLPSAPSGGGDAEDAIVLNAEQQRAIDLCVGGNHVAVIGSAGTGKSVTLRHLVRALKQQRNMTVTNMPVTAPSGIAALNVNGSTIHSWAGIGLGDRSAVDLTNEVLRVPFRKRKWQTCKVLIIDEISMLSGELLDKLEYIGRKVRSDMQTRKEEFFGGIRLLLFGDFAQLPPVKAKMHCFESRTWATLFPRFCASTGRSSASSSQSAIIELKKIMRQRGSSAEEFIDVLQRVRTGMVDDAIVAKLNRLTRPLKFDDGILPTRLYPHNAQVDRENERRVAELPGKKQVYLATDVGECPDAIAQLDKVARAPRELVLKVGVQVVLLWNVDVKGGLVNGSRGVVTALGAAPVVRWANGHEDVVNKIKWTTRSMRTQKFASREQFPLRVSYALTIHKAQGMSIDRLAVSVNEWYVRRAAPRPSTRLL